MVSGDSVDLERLLKLRVVVARVGEMDLARWWNTSGQLGQLGAAAVRRGLPRTHWFAQARSVFAVAAHRCDEVYNLPGSVTLWRLPDDIEERFDAGWEHWLDHASDWEGFFASVAGIADADLPTALARLDLVSESAVATVRDLPLKGGERSVKLPTDYLGSMAEIELLAAGYSRGSIGSLVVPYATSGVD